jgi:toxin ParE1/3/4
MPNFSLTEAAKSDLKSIARFTQKRWGREQRNHYLKTLDDCFHQLSNNPNMGKVCGEIRPGYYKFPTGSHIIYYRSKSNESIEIVRVLHESMDVNTQFLKESGGSH